MLLLTAGIFRKIKKVRNLFCLDDRRNPAIFTNLEPRAQSKLAHAYYVFPPSSLNMVHSVSCLHLHPFPSSILSPPKLLRKLSCKSVSYRVHNHGQ